MTTKSDKENVEPVNNPVSNELPLEDTSEEKSAVKTGAKDEKSMTWQEKLEKGVALNAFDEVKADADFNYRKNLREQTEKREFEALKNRGHEKGDK